MKKLEALLEKIAEICAEVFEDMREEEVAGLIMFLVMMAVVEGFSIWIAVVVNFYFPLAIMTSFWVWLIGLFVNKIFFKKLNNYLLETPKATTLIFVLIFIGTIILSCKYFIGFILSVILAFMLADYQKNKTAE